MLLCGKSPLLFFKTKILFSTASKSNTLLITGTFYSNKFKWGDCSTIVRFLHWLCASEKFVFVMKIIWKILFPKPLQELKNKGKILNHFKMQEPLLHVINSWKNLSPTPSICFGKNKIKIRILRYWLKCLDFFPFVGTVTQMETLF